MEIGIGIGKKMESAHHYFQQISFCYTFVLKCSKHFFKMFLNVICFHMICNYSNKKRSPRCTCIRAREIKGGYACVSIIFLSSRQLLVLYVYVKPLYDCGYISYFTVNYKILCNKNSLVFIHNYIMQTYQ